MKNLSCELIWIPSTRSYILWGWKPVSVLNNMAYFGSDGCDHLTELECDRAEGLAVPNICFSQGLQFSVYKTWPGAHFLIFFFLLKKTPLLPCQLALRGNWEHAWSHKENSDWGQAVSEAIVQLWALPLT